MIALFQEAGLRLRIAYYRRALNNVHAGHEDVPPIVLHLLHLNDRLQRLTSKGN